MFVLSSMRKPPQRFFGVSVKYSRTGAVKLLITRRASQSSKLLRVPFAGLQPVPAAATGLRSAPHARIALAYSALELSRGQCRLTLWGTQDARAEPTWPAQAFSSIRSYVPLLASAYCAAISGALSTRPQRDGVAGRIQRSELLPSRDACGLSNRATKDTPFVAGVASRRSQRSVLQREGPLVSGSGLCSRQVRSMGLWIRFSHA